MKTYYLIILFLAGSFSVVAQYELDPAFGVNGRQTFERGTGSSGYYDVEIQPDGKVVAGGYINNFTQDLLVSRRLPSGMPDLTFGSEGNANIDLGGTEYISDLSIQSDGKIIVCGSVTLPSQVAKFMLMRLNSDGTADNSFGTNGSVIFSNFLTFTTSECQFRNLVIQNDGKIVVTGSCLRNSSQLYVGLAQRYNTDGTLDATFGNAGSKQIIFNSSGHCFPEALTLLSDGKILVAGNAYTNAYLHRIIRLNADGSTDNTFGNNGVASTTFSGFTDPDVRWIEELPDGKLISVGFAWNGSAQRVLVSRHTATGQIDATYATNGFASFAPLVQNNYAYDAFIHANGDLTIVAESYASGIGSAALVRLNSQGALVAGFGTNGIRTYALGEDAFGTSVAITQDTIYIAGGLTEESENFYQGFVSKINADSDPVNGFGTLGLVKSGEGISGSLGIAIIKGDGGDVFITGAHSNLNKDQFAAKIDNNGDPVSDFGDDGFSVYDLGSDENLRDAIRTSDGNLMLLSTTGRANYSYPGQPVSFTAGTHYTLSKMDQNGIALGNSSFTVLANQIPNVKEIKQDNNGKFVVSVSSIPGFYGTFYLARHNADLSLDNSFGNNGKIQLGSNSQFYKRDKSHIVIAPDNDVIELCYYQDFGSDNLSFEFRIKKFNESGSADGDFGNFSAASCYLDGDTVGADPSGVRNLWKFSNGYYINYIRSGMSKILHVDFNGVESTFGRQEIGPTGVVDMKQLADGTFLILCNYGGTVKIYHYFANGSLDAAFNGTGVVEGTPFPESEIVKGFVVNDDNSVVIYHQFGTNGAPKHLGLSKFSLDDATSGIAKLYGLLNDNVVSAYPNPFSGTVTILSKDPSVDLSDFHFTLSDASGRKLPVTLEQVSSGEFRLTVLDQISSGTYFLTGRSADKLIQKTLVK